MSLYIGISILILLGGIILFLYLSPTFGGASTDSQLKMYAKSSQYKDGKFVNTLPVSLDMAAGDMLSIMYKYISPPPMTIPEQSIPVEKMERAEIQDYQGPTRLFWFGHSAFLVQLNDMNILIDPMLGDVPAPHPWLGSGRFNDTLPMNVDQLPDIDAVLISHDHYDHLDYPSIVALRDKVSRFFVPLGVAAHLVKWGIKPSNIRELDWWDEAKLSSLSFICAPAQHFSGRAFSDRSRTLWSSWIIQSDSVQIYFSGDSGYSPHFKEIGDRHGPFDLALMECGQYNTLWPQVHMFPEETVQAGLDLQAKLITPIHWGAFKLSTHAWNEPALRVTQRASEVQLPILIPKIGEPFSPKDSLPSNGIWWSLP